MKTTLHLEAADKDRMENKTMLLIYSKQNLPAPLNGTV